MKKRLGILTAVLLLGMMTVVLLLLGRRISEREWMNLKENEFGIIWNQNLIEEKGILEGDIRYVSLDFVVENWNQRFYWEESNQTVRYALPEELMVLVPGAMSYTVGEKQVETTYPVLLEKAETLWLALDFVAEYTDLAPEIHEDRCVVWLDHPEERNFDTLKKDAKLRVGPGTFHRNLGKILKGTEVYVAEAGDSWTKVMTTDGLTGYVKNSSLSGDVRVEIRNSEFKGPEYTSIRLEEKIVMGWNYIADAPYGLDALKQCLEKDPAINVVSPTWFVLNDNEGGFDSHADPAYITYAREQGLMIWAMVENLSYDVDSHAILSNLDSRQKLIHNLIQAAEEYDLDGINVDFESLESKTGPAYLQFLRELSMECRTRGLVLSVDNYVPKPWTAFYDRKEQGEIVDYVIIMGYDEHYGGGSEAGSTASLAFVEEGIQETLELVPKEKVINAIPFYARLWATAPAELSDGTGVAIEDEELGACYLTSVTKSMEECEDLKMMAETEWLPDVGQNYIRYMEKGIRYEIWLEEIESTKTRVEMIHKYDLAGIACWRLGLETEAVWDVIEKGLREQNTGL